MNTIHLFQKGLTKSVIISRRTRANSLTFGELQVFSLNSRDHTSRYFRWRRKASTTRHCKIPKTEVTGTGRAVDAPDHMVVLIQGYLRCGCRARHSPIYEHSLAVIGGKRFNAGERLAVGARCGSVVTMVRDGRSVYGLVKKFYRVVCSCNRFVDLAVVTWFPFPDYPDDDPLTVKIVLHMLDVNDIVEIEVVPLYDIQPSRVGVEIDTLHGCMYMLRIDDIDTMTVP